MSSKEQVIQEVYRVADQLSLSPEKTTKLREWAGRWMHDFTTLPEFTPTAVRTMMVNVGTDILRKG